MALLGPDLRVRRAAREQPREQRREDDTEHGDHAEHGEGVAQQPVGQTIGLGVVAGIDERDERRDEHGRQRTGREQLEQHVRDRVGRLERVAEVGRAQHRRDHEHAHEPGQARYSSDAPHADRGPGDRLMLRGLEARHHGWGGSGADAPAP